MPDAQPGAITRLEEFSFPTRTKTYIPGHRHLAFDADGGCHGVVATGKDGDISYCYSPDLISWSPLRVVAKSSDRGKAIQPELFVHDNDFNLAYCGVYRQQRAQQGSQGSSICLGTMRQTQTWYSWRSV